VGVVGGHRLLVVAQLRTARVEVALERAWMIVQLVWRAAISLSTLASGSL